MEETIAFPRNKCDGKTNKAYYELLTRSFPYSCFTCPL